MKLPDLLTYKIDDFASAVNTIKLKCLELHALHSAETSKCIQINREGQIERIDTAKEFERDGLMDL